MSYPGNPQTTTAATALLGEPWNEGLCGCFDDCGSCCLTCLAPSVQFGLNSEALEVDSCCAQAVTYHLLSHCGLGWTVHSGRRTALRQKYGLREEGMGDCLTACLCPTLSIMQEAREIKSRSLPRSHPAVQINKPAPGIQAMPVNTMVAAPPAYIPTQPTGLYATVTPSNTYLPLAQTPYNQYQNYNTAPAQQMHYQY